MDQSKQRSAGASSSKREKAVLVAQVRQRQGIQRGVKEGLWVLQRLTSLVQSIIGISLLSWGDSARPEKRNCMVRTPNQRHQDTGS